MLHDWINCSGMSTFVELAFAVNALETVFEKAASIIKHRLKRGTEKFGAKIRTFENADQTVISGCIVSEKRANNKFSTRVSSLHRIFKAVAVIFCVFILVSFFFGWINKLGFWNAVWITPIPMFYVCVWASYFRYRYDMAKLMKKLKNHNEFSKQMKSVAEYLN